MRIALATIGLLTTMEGLAFAQATETIHNGSVSGCAADGTPQFCEIPFTLPFTTGGHFEIKLTEPGHCSSVAYHVYLDGSLVYSSGFLGWLGAPPPFNALPRTTPYVDLGPITAGPHTLALRAQGQPGGCNGGHLSSWGAELRLRTTPTEDSDGDGVIDGIDVFPCDPSAVAESYSPARGVHGTVLAEDFWPTRLDDDVQDLVVTHNYGFASNVDGRVTKIRATYNVLAAGGVIDLGLGVQIPIPASAVTSLSATLGGVPHTVTIGPDTNLTLTLAADLRAAFFGPGTQAIVNALPPAQSPTVPSLGPLEVIIETTPVMLAASGAPFDLFIFRAPAPSHEVHLSSHCGTASMNTALFGTGIDVSSPPAGPCFIDAQGLPALLEVPELIAYPLETINVASVFPMIVGWAASGGTVNQNWYQSPVMSLAYPAPLVPTFNGSPSIVADLSCL